MKTKRIVNAVIWAVLGVVLAVYVWIEWYQQGAGVSSLAVASVFYLMVCACFGFIFDEYIRGN